MTELIDFIVYSGILFNIGIGCRDICLGLVVIVIGDEIFHCIFGEKLFKFRAQLRRERFVVGQHQRWTVHFGNDIRHGKGFARACYTEQGLFLIPFLQTLRKLCNRFGLVTCGHIRRMQFENLRFHLPFTNPFPNHN